MGHHVSAERGQDRDQDQGHGRAPAARVGRDDTLLGGLAAVDHGADQIVAGQQPVDQDARDVQRDQLFYLWRVGFDAFLLRDGEHAAQALAALQDFSEAYQASVERPQPLFRRRHAA